VKAIAEAAGVAVPTVYAIFGSKRAVLSALIDESLSGDHSAAELQDWWIESLRHPNQSERARRLVQMVSTAFSRVAPFERVVREAAGADEEIASLARDLLAWRRATTARVVDVLAGDDGLRPGLDREEAADLLFALAGPEVHHLLVEVRGWSPEQYGAHLAALIDRLIV
jgi:AcrR family transcriptional regulator